MPLAVGENVGPYRITEQLGQGGMATVYKAYHANLDRYVAIKVLHPAFKEDETFFSRFKREAQIVARLEHQHIVPVYDYAESPEPFIVMKFIEGQTLKYRLRRGTISLDETLKIMSAIAAALTYAHKQGILHRDMKPSNVMLDNAGTPYLTDFGLARIAVSGESTMSQDVLIGTPHYISPEQARGLRDLGPETDIYSMGIMLYEIVVGRVPFSADTPYAVVHDHIYKPLPLPSAVNPTVPPQLEAVLLKSLSKEPQDRYSSADDLMAAFKEAVEDSSLSELSATSIQLEKFEQLSRQSEAPEEKLDDYIRNVAHQYLESRMEPAIAAPAYGSTGSIRTGGMGSSASRRRAKARGRRNFWILSGFMALFCVCIASLAVMINALQTPVLANQIEYLPEELTPEATPDLTFVVEMSLEDAEAAVADNPRNPVANMTLAFALLQTGQAQEASEQVAYTITELNPESELIAQAAQLTADQGYEHEAIALWMAAHALDPENPIVRNAAGDYIYRQLIEPQAVPLTVEELEQMILFYPDLALAKVLAAQAIIGDASLTGQPLPAFRARSVERLLEQALRIDDSFAEAHLVYGNYYAVTGDAEQARESWRFARSFADTPAWVARESNLSLQEDFE